MKIVLVSLLLRCLAPLAILAAPDPAAAADAPRCLYVEMANLPVRYVGPGLTPAVDGNIDGMPATMLVDTGAFDTSLTMTGVAKRDLVLHMTGQYVQGFGGFSRLYSARLREFSIGPVSSRRSVDVPVIYETTFPPSFDAIVGAPFLLQADLEVDLRAKRIRLFRPRDCSGVPLKLWSETTVVLDFERNVSNSPNPHFSVTVNGKELDALIDTGAQRSLLSRDAAKRIGIDLDGPGARRLGNSGGVGSDSAPTWIARVDSVQIGGETIRDAELHVIESQGVQSADLYLGQDFLRSHRVLFAMSQRRLYFAYLGGEVFTRGAGLEPWMRAEAEDGNADAQYALARMYGSGRGVDRDAGQAEAWLDKAARSGQPHAGLALGRRAQRAGRPDEAIPLLRKALDQLPAERYGPLWLYNARVQQGDAGLARTELQASLDKQHQDDWPRPLARFYLGKIDAARVLEEAADEKALALRRGCEARRYMAEWHAARGEQAKADALLAGAGEGCQPQAAMSAAAAAAGTE